MSVLEFRVHTVHPVGWKQVGGAFPTSYTHYAVLRFTASLAGDKEIHTYDIADVTSSPGTERPFENDLAYGSLRPGCIIICEPHMDDQPNATIGHILAVKQP